MKILGVDPGTTRIGWGLIEHQEGALRLLDYGTLEIKDKTQQARLLTLGNSFHNLLIKMTPDIAGIEQLFFAKNQKTALSVAEARGVLLLEMMRAEIPVFEYRPIEIKQAVANFGRTDKRGVAKMVALLLGVPALKGHDDASDALAIAIATYYLHRRGAAE